MWRFAVQANLIPGETFREKFEWLAQWGYGGIEVSGAGLLERAEELRGLAAEYPVEITSACAGFDGWLVDRNPRARNLAIAQIKEMLAIGAELGTAGLISPAAYGIDSRGVLPPYRKAFTLEEDRDLLIDSLQQIAKSAEQTGGTLLLEPLNRYVDRVVNTIAEAIGVIEAVDSAHIRLVPDLFHMNIEETNIAASLRQSAPFLTHLHLSDSNRLLPGQGHIDWTEVFAILRDIEYEGTCAIECRISGDPREVLPETLEFLRKIADD